jgi:hypothetical protein
MLSDNVDISFVKKKCKHFHWEKIAECISFEWKMVEPYGLLAPMRHLKTPYQYKHDEL